MRFDPAPVAKSGATSNVGVTEQVKTDVQEAWDWFVANPGAHLYTEEFADEAAQKSWERQARAHAESLGFRFRVVRDDALKSQVEATGKPRIRFHIESQEQYDARQAEKVAREADLAKRKAAGEVIKRGRKASQ